MTKCQHTKIAFQLSVISISPHHNRFTALFPGAPGRAGARRELLDFMVQGKINRGRYTVHPAGGSPSGLTSAHLHHPPIFFTGRMPFLPPNQQCQSTEGSISAVLICSALNKTVSKDRREFNILTRDVASFEYLLIMSECRIGVITDSDNAGFSTVALH